MDLCRGCKKHRIWLWLAVERHSQRIVAWVLGCRGAAKLRRLWSALPDQYRTGTWYFTDGCKAYGHVLSPGAHRLGPKGSGHTSIGEAITCSLRQKCAVLVRKTFSFSRSFAMHHVSMQLVMDEHKRRVTQPDITSYFTTAIKSIIIISLLDNFDTLPVNYLYLTPNTAFSNNLRGIVFYLHK